MTTKQLDKYITQNFEKDEVGYISEKKRAAVYVRFSSENQRDGYSVEYQMDECRKYIEENDMQFVRAYVDEATTGKTTNNRNAFFEMLNDVKRGLYECVVVYKYSRFARNLVEATIYRQQIEKSGATLISAMERIDDSTPEGKMMRNIIMVMDEYYSENLAVFVQSSMHTAAKSGKMMGSPAPLGYKYNENRLLEIDEQEAEIVRSIFELYANGFSYADILRWLRDRGLRTRRGKYFSESGIYAILRNEKYIGRFVYSVEGYETIIIDDALPALISADVWQRVQNRIEDWKNNTYQPTPRRSKNRAYPLTGKIICACCGNHYIGESKATYAATGTQYNYYSCRGKKRMQVCKNKSVRKDLLENYVFGELKKHLLNPAIIDRIAQETFDLVSDGTGDVEAEIKSLKSDIVKVEKRLEALLDAMLDGDIPKSIMNRKSEKLNAELSDLQKQLERKNVEATTSTSYDMVRGYLLQLMTDLEHGDDDMKKAVVQQMVKQITVSEDEITVEIGVNFDYFFRDTAQCGGANLRLSQKRKDLKRYE